MQEVDNTDTLRQDQQSLLKQNFEVFFDLIAQSRAFLRTGRYEAAVSYAEMAAHYAQFNHGGFFTSPDLEQILLAVGKQISDPNVSPQPNRSSPKQPQRILHVSTNVSTYSGIPRLIRRWIQQDRDRIHSLALTVQFPTQVPDPLSSVVLNSGGKIHLLNEKLGGYIDRAKRLRQCAHEADMVILHTWEHDPIPTIAFANKEECPPVIYTNHGDHCHWLGAGVSDVIANLRESGMHLSQKRRGIEPKRNMLLPIILEPANRTCSRQEAKRYLGLDEDSMLLLSVARAPKYKSLDGTNFAATHVSLLQKYQNAILTVIGAGDNTDEDWSAAIQSVPSRIQVLGQTEETKMFYQAADIYIDSFPIGSNTSLLEAASYGTPVVTRYLYPSESCDIFGSDMPGLTGNMIRARSLEEYISALSGLMADAELRRSLGVATQRQVEANHWGSSWMQLLEEVYLRASTLPRVRISPDAATEMFLGEPDILYGSHTSVGKANLDQIRQWQMPMMPWPQRLQTWLHLVQKNGWRSTPLNLLLPEGIKSRYYRLRSSRR